MYQAAVHHDIVSAGVACTPPHAPRRQAAWLSASARLWPAPRWRATRPGRYDGLLFLEQGLPSPGQYPCARLSPLQMQRSLGPRCRGVLCHPCASPGLRVCRPMTRTPPWRGRWTRGRSARRSGAGRSSTRAQTWTLGPQRPAPRAGSGSTRPGRPRRACGGGGVGRPRPLRRPPAGAARGPHGTMRPLLRLGAARSVPPLRCPLA